MNKLVLMAMLGIIVGGCAHKKPDEHEKAATRAEAKASINELDRAIKESKY